jgi:hypothetical protein
MLILPEGKNDEAWETFKKQFSFANPAALDIKLISLYFNVSVGLSLLSFRTGRDLISIQL